MSSSSDHFNRADGALGVADSGQAWSVHGNPPNPYIAANKAQFPNGLARGSAVIDHGTGDGDYQVAVYDSGFADQSYGGIELRWIDQNNMLRCYIAKESGNYHLVIDRWVANAYQAILANGAIGFVDGRTLACHLAGTALHVSYGAGLYTFDVVVPALAGGTSHGIMGDATSVGNVQSLKLDDWSGQPLTRSRWGLKI